jgi:1-phosphofructokinase
VILTLTPNPSVDRTLFVSTLSLGAISRSHRSRSEPSGKGVNVSLALAARGHPTRAVFPAGGFAGLQIQQMLGEADVAYVAVPIGGEVRSNISLVEPSGRVTKVNEAGPVLTADEADRFFRTACDQLDEATWLAGCGSLPEGLSEDLYARLADACHERGVQIAIDTWGGPLRRVLAHGPDLVAPNLHELAQAVDRSITTIGDALDCAGILLAKGAGAVLGSLGPDGAVLVDQDGAWHGESMVDTVVSAVGAGDALLAGFLSVGSVGPRALNAGLQWAGAAVQHEGTGLSDVYGARAVIHPQIDRRRLLTEPVPAPGHS